LKETTDPEKLHVAYFWGIFGDDQNVETQRVSWGVYDSSKVVWDMMNPIKILGAGERELRAL
jgi:hypothetical protein